MCARARERKSKCVCVCVCVLVLREMGDVRFFEVRPFNLFPLPFNLSILQSFNLFRFHHRLPLVRLAPQ
jgi:hypothetical protein